MSKEGRDAIRSLAIGVLFGFLGWILFAALFRYGSDESTHEVYADLLRNESISQILIKLTVVIFVLLFALVLLWASVVSLVSFGKYVIKQIKVLNG